MAAIWLQYYDSYRAAQRRQNDARRRPQRRAALYSLCAAVYRAGSPRPRPRLSQRQGAQSDHQRADKRRAARGDSLQGGRRPAAPEGLRWAEPGGLHSRELGA